MQTSPESHHHHLLPVDRLLADFCSAHMIFASSCWGAQGCWSAPGCGPPSIFFGCKTRLWVSCSPSHFISVLPAAACHHLSHADTATYKAIPQPGCWNALQWGVQEGKGAGGKGWVQHVGMEWLDFYPEVYMDKIGARSSVFPCHRSEVWSTRVAAPTFPCLHLLY